MKNMTKIAFGFLIVIIIGFCLFYTNKTHEGFDESIVPIVSTQNTSAPNQTNQFSNNEIQTIDKTINNLGVFANGLSTLEPSKISQEQLQDLQTNFDRMHKIWEEAFNEDRIVGGTKIKQKSKRKTKSRNKSKRKSRNKSKRKRKR